MIITIHQPDFMPWLGFFDRWHRADVLIVLDDVQFIRRGWQHRDKIKTAQGVQWLTLPVIKRHRFDQKINEVELDNSQNWRKKHLGQLRAAYGKAPGFKRMMDYMEYIYSYEYTYMIDLNVDLLRLFSKLLGIDTPAIASSKLPVRTTGSQRILDLVKLVGGTTYLTGTGSEDYLDEDLFREAGIKVVWQNYVHPVYSQLHGRFEPMLSVIDYLMNEGRRLDDIKSTGAPVEVRKTLG